MVVPIRQFGAILGVCTLAAAVLTLLISPAAMLPPFRLEVPVRAGSTSRVTLALNRLTAWVVDHPGWIVFADVVLKATRQQRWLPAVLTLDEAAHLKAPDTVLSGF